jgi:serine phosphatase RsbU (regulator of sigma subunit)
VRVLAGALPEPGALLRSLNAEVASIPNAVGATMAYAVVDPAAGTLQHLLAGHPPPLLLRAAGGAELLAGEPWPPLGVTPTDEPGIPTTRLQPGDTVVLYTDGVIERRGESLTAGLERLRAVGEDLGDLVPEDLCDALLEALVPSDDQADDVAVVAIRLLAHPADPDGSGDRARPGSVAATSRVGR